MLFQIIFYDHYAEILFYVIITINSILIILRMMDKVIYQLV
jgi:hypothetical protein